jgi:hypothetical protein
MQSRERKEVDMTVDRDRRVDRRRLLVAAPGVIGPLALLVLIVWYAVGAFVGYYTLRPARWALGAEGPIGDGQLALFVAGAVAVALLLLVPPLLVARPGRLRPWTAVAALAIELPPLWFTFSLVASHNGWGLILLALFAYVPAVIVARLVAQRQEQSRRPAATPQAQ